MFIDFVSGFHIQCCPGHTHARTRTHTLTRIHTCTGTAEKKSLLNISTLKDSKSPVPLKTDRQLESVCYTHTRSNFNLMYSATIWWLRSRHNSNPEYHFLFVWGFGVGGWTKRDYDNNSLQATHRVRTTSGKRIRKVKEQGYNPLAVPTEWTTF